MKSIVFGGLVFLMAAFAFAAAYSSQSRRRNEDRRDHGDGGPGVFASDTGSDFATGDAGGGDGGGNGGGD